MAIISTAFMIEPRAVNAGYQQYKGALLILLGLMGFFVLILQAADSGAWRLRCWRMTRLNPLIASLIGLLFCVMASTVLSVDWRSSLWGSYEMGQGAITWLAAFVVLALVARFMRSWAQVWRLIDVLLVVSATVSVHAIVQRLGYDPQALNMNGRAFGMAGNPIYLGGYLVMGLPLTLGRMITLWGTKHAGPGWRRALILLCVAAQLGALVCTASRGPLIGLLAVVGLFVPLMAFTLRWRRLQHWLVALVGVGVAVALVGLVYAAMSQTAGSTGGVSVPLIGTDSGRSAFWARAPELIAGGSPLRYPSGGADRFHGWRAWIGHGLETLPQVLPEYFPAAPGFVIENRFHNAAWDQAYAMGIVGLIAMFAVLASVFGLGFRALGLLPTRAAMWVFGGCIGVCTIGLAFLLAFVLGVGFTGLGLVVGFSLGLIVAASVLACRCSSPDDGNDNTSALLVASVVASLIGHLTDMAFVFESAPTFTLLFVLVGLMLASHRGFIVAAAASIAPVMSKREKHRVPTTNAAVSFDWRGAVARAALVSGGLVLLIYALNHEQSFEPLNAVDVLAYSFCNLEGTQGHYSLMVLPLVVFWLAGSWALSRREGEADGRADARLFQLVLLISGGVGLVYALINSVQIVGIGPIPRRAAATDLVLAQAHTCGVMLLTCIVLLGVLTLLVGWGLMPRLPAPASRNRSMWAVSGCGVIAWLGGTWHLVVTPLVADAKAQWGMALESFGRTRLAAEVYEAAIRQRPEVFAYRVLLTEILLQQAEAAPDATESRAAWQQAERTLVDGRRYSELNRSALYLGRIYVEWALAEEGPVRTALAEKAATALAQAAVFEPMFEPVLREQSLLQRLVVGDATTGTMRADEALRYAEDAPLPWAEYYAVRAARSSHAGLVNELNSVALGYFDLAIKNAEHSELLARAQAGKGKILLTSGHVASSIPWLLAAVNGCAPHERCQIHVMLIQAYAQQNDFLHAREQVDLALQLASPDQRAELQQFRQLLEGR